MKVVLFGTGSAARQIYAALNPGVMVVAVADNNPSLWGKQWNGIRIVDPENLRAIEYDYIIVGSIYTRNIVDGLIAKGIDRSRIIPYYDNYYIPADRATELAVLQTLMASPTHLRTPTGQIALLTRGPSGCNAYALYKAIPESLSNRFTISLMTRREYSYHRDKNRFDVLITTNLESRWYRHQINMDFWHGFPLKSLGHVEHNCTDDYSNISKRTDHAFSYSSLYSYIMSSVFSIDIRKFHVTGMPRNDLLASKRSAALLSDILRSDCMGKRIVFYLPTFRRRLGKSLRDGAPVVSNMEDLGPLDRYMKQNGILLIVKCHPAEGDTTEKGKFDNIRFLEEGDLVRCNVDLYELLGASEMLITDYSSVYFDYLLLRKPVVFWIADFQVYCDGRGLMFDNYRQMMPGPIATNVADLMQCIERFSRDADWYGAERSSVSNLVHHFQDFNSSERAWQVISYLYSKHFETAG